MNNLTPYIEGMSFGAGVNSLNGDIKGDAVVVHRDDSGKVVRLDPPDLNNSQKVEILLKRIESREEFEESLGLSVAGNFSYGFFKANAKVDFSKNIKRVGYNLYFLIRVTVENGFQRMRDVEIKDIPKKMLEDGRFNQFQERNGDCFVLGMKTGGVFYALLEFHTSSEEEKTKLSASLKMEFGTGLTSTEMSIAMENSIKNSKTNQDVTFQVLVEPADSKQALLLAPDVSAILDYAKDFHLVVKEMGAPYAVLLQEYTDLDIPNAPNAIDLEKQRDSIKILIKRKALLVDLRDKIDFILEFPEQFEEITPLIIDDLTQKRNHLQQLINDAFDLASKCANSYKVCDVPAFENVSYVLPKRRQTAIKDPINQLIDNPPPFAQDWIKTKDKKPLFEDGIWRIQAFDVKIPNKDSKWQKESLGSAIYHNTQTKKVFLVYGDIYQQYLLDNHEFSSRLGYPTSHEMNYPQGRVSYFENGMITWNAANRELAVTLSQQPFLEKIKSMAEQGIVGWEGKAISPIEKINEEWSLQQFKWQIGNFDSIWKGTEAFSALYAQKVNEKDYKIYAVYGHIYAAYLNHQAHNGKLGFPLNDETGTPDKVGRYNHFQNGSIYWTPSTGAQIIDGAIRDKWAELGWERSELGYPVSSTLTAPDGVGRFSHFQNGSIYWTPQTGAHFINGAIRDKWAELGWELSELGYPISDIKKLDINGLLKTTSVDFQFGSIIDNDASIVTGIGGMAVIRSKP